MDPPAAERDRRRQQEQWLAAMFNRQPRALWDCRAGETEPASDPYSGNGRWYAIGAVRTRDYGGAEGE